MNKLKKILLYLSPLYFYIGFLTILYYMNPGCHVILNWFDFIAVKTALYFLYIEALIVSLFI